MVKQCSVIVQAEHCTSSTSGTQTMSVSAVAKLRSLVPYSGNAGTAARRWRRCVKIAPCFDLTPPCCPTLHPRTLYPSALRSRPSRIRAGCYPQFMTELRGKNIVVSLRSVVESSLGEHGKRRPCNFRLPRFCRCAAAGFGAGAFSIGAGQGLRSCPCIGFLIVLQDL